MNAILIFLLLLSNISLATIVLCRKNNGEKPSVKSENDKKSAQPDDNEPSDDSTQDYPPPMLSAKAHLILMNGARL